jgi:hypothetical protein
MMRTRDILVAALGLAGALAILLAGCVAERPGLGPETPNAAPETRIDAQTPVPLEAGILVKFSWSGSDPDGTVKGYQWKMCHLGCDGISAKDSLTIDPVTGCLLHPWHFTTASDSAFVVSCSLQDGAGDPCEAFALLVRAVDARGCVDPTPACVCFTPRTVAPTVTVDRPAHMRDYMDAQPMPPTAVFGYTGIDPDEDLGMPREVRFLFKTGWIDNPPHYVRTRYEFVQYVEQIASFSDSAWSDWLPYTPNPAQRVIAFPNLRSHDDQGLQIAYFLVLQARDSEGMVSLERQYSDNVQNFYITTTMTPQLTVWEPNLGLFAATGMNSRHLLEIAGGQGLNFSWLGSAERYGSTIVTYRYGWDVLDPDDPEDPNWAVPPGVTMLHRKSPEQVFSSGAHTLTIQCQDFDGQTARISIVLDVMPVPDPAQQRPLLLVDDVPDRTSNGWIAADGITPLDRDVFRDAFWQRTLAGSGGVEGFNTGRDIVDTEVEDLRYRDLIQYRSVLWTTRYSAQSFIFNNFKAYPNGEQPFIWLSSYQENVGNLLMAGERAMNGFIEEAPWMIPWIFDTDEEFAEFGSQLFRVGFGNRELPDGTILQIGRMRYPYAAMGIAVLDHVTPRYNIWGCTGFGCTGNSARNSSCVGVKGLLLDEAFRAAYMPQGDVFPDTIYTEATIDWMDLQADHYDSLRVWIWGSDEIYDGNITDRLTPWTPQACIAGPCVEPMFRIYSRFDWVDDLHLAAGDPDWPAPIFNPQELVAACGQHALDGGTGRTRTTGHVLGFLSHKLVDHKPSARADVLWGFDPYRFDHDHIRQAIHWVLGEHFGLVLRP